MSIEESGTSIDFEIASSMMENGLSEKSERSFGVIEKDDVSADAFAGIGNDSQISSCSVSSSELSKNSESENIIEIRDKNEEDSSPESSESSKSSKL